MIFSFVTYLSNLELVACEEVLLQKVLRGFTDVCGVDHCSTFSKNIISISGRLFHEGIFWCQLISEE